MAVELDVEAYPSIVLLFIANDKSYMSIRGKTKRGRRREKKIGRERDTFLMPRFT